MLSGNTSKLGGATPLVLSHTACFIRRTKGFKGGSGCQGIEVEFSTLVESIQSRFTGSRPDFLAH
jgi:hypothetical protein